MKKSIMTMAILSAGFLFSTSSMISCNAKKAENQEQKESEEHKEGGDHDHEMTYACPMHPEVTGKEGDTCSKCGMKLDAVEKTDSSAHEHKH
ncbi:MAG: hypothetical protein OJF59_001691 [Cytophagales bacterium]|jgi:hypothetical protein|nr:hypothetical protein [Bacteroidota bacterium]MBS1980616.1 hypothetical protein [Bacteroidota bacterium]WHZ07938.1 MAG: hypothetical protein OJF59_001691 [Cytophagales bacterium]